MDKQRPKPAAMVQYDSNNFYSQLGISPLMPTDEIKSLITTEQMRAKGAKRGQSAQKFGSAEEDFIVLQKLLDTIGNAKKREQYDYDNPQNQVLTVQPSPYDKWLDPKKQCDLVSAFLVEVLGQECWLPHPDSLPLWLPTNLDPETEAFLVTFTLNHPIP